MYDRLVFSLFQTSSTFCLNQLQVVQIRAKTFNTVILTSNDIPPQNQISGEKHH